MDVEISQKEESSHVLRVVIVVVLNLGDSAPQGPTGNVWGTCLVVTTWDGGCYWSPVGRGRDIAKHHTMHRTVLQDRVRRAELDRQSCRIGDLRMRNI